MRAFSLLNALVCFYQCLIFPSAADRVNDWTDVVMVQEGSSVTLPCTDSLSTLADQVTWMMMRAEEKRWTSLLSVNTSKDLTDRVLNKPRRLGGRTFEIYEDVSLQFITTPTDGGRYSCLMQQRGRKLKERIILLALIKLTLAPAPSIPADSTVRLRAQVSPSYAVAGGTWWSPSGVRLLTVFPSPGTLRTKLPRVSRKDNGLYTCTINTHGQSSKPEYNYTLTVTVNDKTMALFSNITYGPTQSKASLSRKAVTVPCPPIYGDYVRLYWWRPDQADLQAERVFQFDRWRNETIQTKPGLQLINRSSPTAKGNVSFTLKAALADAGRYQCEVFFDNNVFCQSTTLTILHGYARAFSSSLDLTCMYSERSQVKSVEWTHVQRPHLKLPLRGMLGKLTISIPLPITSELVGQYVCTLHMINKQTLQYMYPVTLVPTERPCCESQWSTTFTTDLPGSLLTPAGKSVSQPSVLLPSLALLLFLVPVVTVAVGVLLRKQGRCTFRRNVDVEHTLSHNSGEVENIYENPEDLRQTPASAAVYMDLKPTGETDVYKELDRYDPCCG